jgi:hypothetical protein
MSFIHCDGEEVRADLLRAGILHTERSKSTGPALRARLIASGAIKLGMTREEKWAVLEGATPMVWLEVPTLRLLGTEQSKPRWKPSGVEE